MADRYMLTGIDNEPSLFVILENGQNVLNADALRFDLERTIKRNLVKVLKDFVRGLRTENDTKVVFDEFQKRGVLKKIEKQKSVHGLSLWEIRDSAHGGRVFFVFVEPDTIIVSAVNKVKFSQDQAINRGAKRWKALLKNLEKKA